MRGFVQMISVLAIAMGCGLFAFGSHLEPRVDLANFGDAARFVDPYNRDSQHMIASVTCGFGIGFMCLGGAGLIIPWLNRHPMGQIAELGNNSARTISAVGIWLSVAFILTFGLFQTHWSGASAMVTLLFMVIFICAAATASIALLAGWSPWKKPTAGT